MSDKGKSVAMQSVITRLKEIFNAHCSDYPKTAEQCDAHELMWAIESTLSGWSKALDDWARFSDYIGISTHRSNEDMARWFSTMMAQDAPPVGTPVTMTMPTGFLAHGMVCDPEPDEPKNDGRCRVLLESGSKCSPYIHRVVRRVP